VNTAGGTTNVLVAVASRHGATREIAEAIGRELTAAGVAADVRAVEDVEDLEGYTAIVLGSAVYVGSWLQPATAFAVRHGDRLRRLHTWLFSSGPIGDPPHPADEHALQIDEVLAETGAREHRVFTGRLDKHLLGFGEWAVVLAVRAPKGDFRDWEAIDDWSRGIAAAIRGTGTDR
jgi:menaquinone-dependent protoporphyrinogen oxidase